MARQGLNARIMFRKGGGPGVLLFADVRRQCPCYDERAGEANAPCTGAHILVTTFEQMSGAIGSLVLLWARIEAAVRAEIMAVHGHLPKSAHGIQAALYRWEDDIVADGSGMSFRASLASALRMQLVEALAVRNGICHGLDSISSGAEAGLTWVLNGDKHSISAEALQASLAWLSRISFAISLLARPGRMQSRLLDSVENREWWLMEFGIDPSKVD